MIAGYINAFSEAIIPIHLRDISGAVHEFEAVLDTGFNGSLTLSSEVIGHLQLPWRTRGSAELADGSIETFDIHSAAIIWDGVPRSILVSSVETKPLSGMRLLTNCDLRMRVQTGGLVEIVSVNDGGLDGLTANR